MGDIWTYSNLNLAFHGSDNVLFRDALVVDGHSSDGGRHRRDRNQLLPARGRVAVRVERGRGGPDVTRDGGDRGRHHPRRPLQGPHQVAGLQRVVDVVVGDALVHVVPVVNPVLGMGLTLGLGAVVEGDWREGGPLVVPQGDVPLEGEECWLWQKVPGRSKERMLVLSLKQNCLNEKCSSRLVAV